jgi:hypothetical protein
MFDRHPLLKWAARAVLLLVSLMQAGAPGAVAAQPRGANPPAADSPRWSSATSLPSPRFARGRRQRKWNHLRAGRCGERRRLE